MQEWFVVSLEFSRVSKLRDSLDNPKVIVSLASCTRPSYLMLHAEVQGGLVSKSCDVNSLYEGYKFEHGWAKKKKGLPMTDNCCLQLVNNTCRLQGFTS